MIFMHNIMTTVHLGKHCYYLKL